MIGKVTQGKSFRGCLLYVLNDKKPEHEDEIVMKNRAEVILYNECFGNPRELIDQFREVQKLNPKVSKPVLHASLSLPEGEVVSRERLADMAKDCAKKLGFDKNQYVVVLHKDSKHQHIHVVANRITFDGKTISDSHNYKKMAELCRTLEQKHQLTQVLSPRVYLPKHQQELPRFDERKLKMKQTIEAQLQQSRSIEDFKERMKQQGYKVETGRGIAFTDDKDVRVKGSELDYSLMTIQKILAEQEKQRQRLQLKSANPWDEKSQQQKLGPGEKGQKPRQEKIWEDEKQKPQHLHKHKAFHIPDHSTAAKYYHKQQQESMPYELSHNPRKRKRHRGHDHDSGMSM